MLYTECIFFSELVQKEAEKEDSSYFQKAFTEAEDLVRKKG